MTTKSVFPVLITALLIALPADARTPTNSAAAFRTFDIYGERASSMNTVDHLNFTSYPSAIASPPLLLVVRPTPGSPDTMALFNSFAKNATYFEVNTGPTQSFTTFNVTPASSRPPSVLS